jgi:hypothetical protein
MEAVPLCQLTIQILTPKKPDDIRGEYKLNSSPIMHWMNCILEHEEESQ